MAHVWESGAGEDSRYRSHMSRAVAGPLLPTGNLGNWNCGPVARFAAFQKPRIPAPRGHGCLSMGDWRKGI